MADPIKTVITDPATGRSFTVLGPATPSESERALILKELRKTPKGMAPVGGKDVWKGVQYSARHVFGALLAPRAALTARTAALAEHPEDMGGAGRAGRQAFMESMAGQETASPSSEYHRLSHTPASPFADLAADSVLDPANAILPGGRGLVQDVGTEVLEQGVTAARDVRRLYYYVAAFMLPQMNTPRTGRYLVNQLTKAGMGAIAESNGFKAWLLSHGSATVSRAKVVSRLLMEPEFRNVISRFKTPALRTATIAKDYHDRQHEAQPAVDEDEGPLLKWLLPAASAAGSAKAIKEVPRGLSKIGGIGELAPAVNSLLGGEPTD